MSMRLIRRSSVALLGAILVLSTFAIAPVLAVAVNAVNDGTAGVPFQFFAEDAAAGPVDVIANDLGFDGATSAGLTITAKTDGTFGTVAISAGLRGVTYHPNANSSGADSFTYTVTDGVTTDTATAFVTVNSVNDAPSFVLLADPSVAEDSGAASVVGFSTGNKGGPEESAQVLTYIIESNSNAALFSALPAISSAGDLTFTPAANANGADTVVVHVVDNGPNGGGDVNFSPPQTFHINVTAVNDAPVAVADAYGVPANTVHTVAVGTGVLVNDTDIDTLHTALTAVLNVTTAHGALTLNANGSFTYTPTALYVGADSFTYHANDGALSSNIVAVSLTVTAESPPNANADSATIPTGSGATAIAVLANDTDADIGDTLTIVSATVPAHGTVAITGSGTGLTYHPASGFVGTDTFSYTISDGLLTDSAVVTVHVVADTFKPVATAPVQTIGSQIVGATTVKVHLTWSATDVGSGVAKYELWQSTDGAAYFKVKTTTAQSANVQFTRNHTYQFRVRAIDKAGNIGSYAVGPLLKFAHYEETSATYSVPWQIVNSASYSGGHAATTSTAGRTASLATTGRTFTWIGAHGPTRSTADVYIDGVFTAHVNLFSTVKSYGRVIYSITFASKAAHQIRIVYTGLTSGRIDLDQIIVLR
jgi:VCBS repeat-containing protein